MLLSLGLTDTMRPTNPSINYELIPPFNDNGFLPSGLYDTSLSEIRLLLGGTQKRSRLIIGLERYIKFWDSSGFITACIIDGSFVTSKPDPGDVDLLLVADLRFLLSPRFNQLVASHSLDRKFTKEEFDCEGFVVLNQPALNEWIDYFSHDDRVEGNVHKGLLRINFPL